MKREDELIRRAIRKGMPDKETVLNHCILALEKEEKEKASMKAQKIVPRKIFVAACVAVSIMAASTICYAATGEFPIRLFINGVEKDANDYITDDNTIHIEDEESSTSTDIQVEPGTQADINVEDDEVTMEIYDDEPGEVSIEEKSLEEK